VKNSLLLTFFIVLTHIVYAGKKDPVFSDLNRAINNKELYVKLKEDKIAALKRINVAGLPLLQEYQVNRNLYEEYRKFKIDSAIHYANRNIEIAETLNKEELGYVAQIQLANLYSSSGKYRESEMILKSINKSDLSKELLPPYYQALIQFFEHYATNSYSKEYMMQVDAYRDSLIGVLDRSSLQYRINLAQKYISQGKTAVAQKDLLGLLKEVGRENADYAMISYLLGVTYKQLGDPASEKKYLAISATADIKNATKDHAAIQNLALIYFKAGDVHSAHRFTNSAIEDAIFCNVQFRTLRMSGLYSIINTAYLEEEAKQKSQLQLYLVLISTLSIFLIVAIIYVYKQMKRVSRIKEELHLTGEKLAELNRDISRTNEQLSERNAQLSESNHVKEEYIAQFFDLCSTYINKLENYRKALNKKATDKQLDELFKMLRSTTVVDNEVEELYKIFDNIFLNLYPDFVREFNALLIREEQVCLKPGELLNTELRIFALIRLGITDSVKIAAFLRYSLSTIYNYRTRARNKAAVSRDEFEGMVMRIGSIPSRT
jgi:hypothetical protein